MNTIELRNIAGMRNDVSPERFGRDELGRRTNKTELQSAINVDLDETGKIMRRLGTQRLLTGSAHSLYATGENAYFVRDGVLSRLDQDLTCTPITPVAGRVAMTRIGDAVYWSDGKRTGMLVGATNVPWGIDVPPVLTAKSTVGSLRAGRYMFAMTYVRASGEESGAPRFGEIVLGPNQGISFQGLPVSNDPLVTSKRIYLTGCDGEVAYLAATLTNSDTSAVLTNPPAKGMALRTQFMGPPPAGQVVGAFAGRTYVASGRHLWYSQPYENGLFDRRSGFVSLPSAVQTFAPLSNGIFVGSSEKTYWLDGLDPAQWKQLQVATFGTVLGTESVLRGDVVGQSGVPGNVAAWFSSKGLCLGFDGGEMKNVTGGRYFPPEANEGASLMKIRGGTPQLVTTLFK